MDQIAKMEREREGEEGSDTHTHKATYQLELDVRVCG